MFDFIGNGLAPSTTEEVVAGYDYVGTCGDALLSRFGQARERCDVVGGAV